MTVRSLANTDLGILAEASAGFLGAKNITPAGKQFEMIKRL